MDAAARGEQLRQAVKQALKPRADVDEDERGVGGDESVSEALSKEVFSTYTCRTITHPASHPHPGDIAEATSLRYFDQEVPKPKFIYAAQPRLGLQFGRAGQAARDTRWPAQAHVFCVLKPMSVYVQSVIACFVLVREAREAQTIGRGRAVLCLSASIPYARCLHRLERA